MGRNFVRLDPYRVAHLLRVDMNAAQNWFESDPLWFKTALFYEIHLRGFFDGTGDGHGDFRGLTEKLDYLQWLGVDVIWLLPMYPSPMRDGGYDIADFYGVHEDYGTMDDVRAFIGAAHERAGAGKSTMMSLLNRFYDVQQGQILVDDVPITQLRQRELRRKSASCCRTPSSSPTRWRRTSACATKSMPLEQVHEAARTRRRGRLHPAPAGGLRDAMLAERGANLSTGQKQLVALARVAAFNPQIVLVMDEATASIDPETEATLQRSIQRVMEGRTSIVIAHRLNTIRYVDRILVLHQGRIVEQGTHEALLASTRRLLPAVRAAVQGPGHRRGLKQLRARRA